jgi:protein involved in polysaccharide export with SLBB domain
VQTRYKDPEAQVSMAPSAPSSPELNVVEEPVTPPLEAEQGVVNHLNHNADLMGSYLIETGDSLEIKFRETPELDNVVTVRPDGLISLQIVGDVPAAGLTPELMRQALVSAYSAELTKPDIAVIVRSFSGNSIYVGGEVFAPGRVPLTGRVTTLNAIILAGGFKDTADQQRVVVRHGDGTCCEYDLKSVLKCEGKGQDIQLRPYDVVYVPKSKIAKVNLFVEQYIDKVIPFSRNFGVFISRNTGLTSAVASP